MSRGVLSVYSALLQGSGMSGGGVSMSRVPSTHTFSSQHPRRVIGSELTDKASHSLDEMALLLRRQTSVAHVLDGSQDPGEEKQERVKPPLDRAWLTAPRSLLSTTQTRKTWFRYMQFNMMVDRWSEYNSSVVSSALNRTNGSQDGDWIDKLESDKQVDPKPYPPSNSVVQTVFSSKVAKESLELLRKAVGYASPTTPIPLSEAAKRRRAPQQDNLEAAVKLTEVDKGESGTGEEGVVCSSGPTSTDHGSTAAGCGASVSFSHSSDCITSPVVPPHIRVPQFVRRTPRLPGHGGSEAAASEVSRGASSAYEPYNSALHLCPPYLTREHRRQHLVQLLRAYDPDLVTLNEVNRGFFFEEIFKFVRYLGYGAVFQSSRGARVKALRPGDDPTLSKHRHKIPASEDIGNVILFHKGRFVPLLSPGDYGIKHLHQAQIVNFRDRVTNLSTLVVSLQLTAGNTPLAAKVRAYEAKQVVAVVGSMQRYDSDRAHQTVVVSGDLNNESMEEECVEVLRDKLFSTYDLAGGPRWTTWYYSQEPPSPEMTEEQRRACMPPYERYTPYFEKNVAEYKRSEGSTLAESELRQHILYRREAAETAALIGDMKKNAADKGAVTKLPTSSFSILPPEMSDAPSEVESCIPWDFLAPGNSKPKPVSTEPLGSTPPCSGAPPTEKEAAESVHQEPSKKETESSSLPVPEALKPIDALAAATPEAACTVKRTQDFIFYDPNRLALHQLLDVPEEKEFKQEQLLPCTILPSHHLPLLADFSFNDLFPDVGDVSLKP